jgi:hypothetical protein
VPDDDGTRPADFWTLLARVAADEKSALGAVGRENTRRDARATLRVVNIVHDKQQKFEEKKGTEFKRQSTCVSTSRFNPKSSLQTYTVDTTRLNDTCQVDGTRRREET